MVVVVFRPPFVNHLKFLFQGKISIQERLHMIWGHAHVGGKLGDSAQACRVDTIETLPAELSILHPDFSYLQRLSRERHDIETIFA